MRSLFLSAATAIGLLATAGPTSANSPELQHTVVPASACDISFATSRPWLTTGFRYLRTNGRVNLQCPVPVAGGPDVSISSFRLLYRDPDGRVGNASVKAFLVVTSFLDPFQPLASVTSTCQFVSNIQGLATTGWTIADIACPVPVAIPAGGYAEILVELWRRGRGDSSFYPALGAIQFP